MSGRALPVVLHAAWREAGLRAGPSGPAAPARSALRLLPSGPDRVWWVASRGARTGRQTGLPCMILPRGMLNHLRSTVNENGAAVGAACRCDRKRRAGWRRGWDSNPRWSYPHTRFPSELLQPLGHLSSLNVLAPAVEEASGRAAVKRADDSPSPDDESTRPDCGRKWGRLRRAVTGTPRKPFRDGALIVSERNCSVLTVCFGDRAGSIRPKSALVPALRSDRMSGGSTGA